MSRVPCPSEMVPEHDEEGEAKWVAEVLTEAIKEGYIHLEESKQANGHNVWTVCFPITQFEKDEIAEHDEYLQDMMKDTKEEPQYNFYDCVVCGHAWDDGICWQKGLQCKSPGDEA